MFRRSAATKKCNTLSLDDKDQCVEPIEGKSGFHGSQLNESSPNGWLENV